MAIVVSESYFDGDKKRTPMDSESAKTFKMAVDGALAIIESCVGGPAFLADCRTSATLTIFRVGEKQHNCGGPDAENAGDFSKCCYQEVVTKEKLSAKLEHLLESGKIKPDHPAVNRYLKFYSRSGKFGKEGTHPAAHDSTKPYYKDVHKTDSRLRSTIDEFGTDEQIARDTAFVRSLQNGLVGYQIMEHLTRGPGLPAHVAWDPSLYDAGVNLPSDQRQGWMKRPSWIALAHEMIHAWRCVTGRHLFRPGQCIEEYYEEALTVGLPPYDRCAYTENKFRKAAAKCSQKVKLPLRTCYGPTSKSKSTAAQEKHGSVESRLPK